MLHKFDLNLINTVVLKFNYKFKKILNTVLTKVVFFMQSTADCIKSILYLFKPDMAIRNLLVSSYYLTLSLTYEWKSF